MRYTVSIQPSRRLIHVRPRQNVIRVTRALVEKVDVDDEAHLLRGYIQSGDPGAVGAGYYWVDTSLGHDRWKLKVRNMVNSGWELVGGGGGSGFVDVGGGLHRLYHPDEQTSYFEARPGGGLAIVINGQEQAAWP